MNSKDPTYDADSIKILKGLEAVKKRPGMYIGETSHPHHMVYEIMDNAIDEAMAGHCDHIIVTLYQNGSISIKDNGRGVPTEIHQEMGISAAEVIMTQLHAGGKFDQNSYKVSGGLHGVGASVVNALSDYLELRIWKKGHEYFIRFREGAAEEPLKVVGSCDPKLHGTQVLFYPSKTTFESIVFNPKTLENRFRELSFLNSKLKIVFLIEENGTFQEQVFFSDHGVRDFVKYLSIGKNILHKDVIALKKVVNDTDIEVGLLWTDSYFEHTLCFTNNIPQADGGTHLSGFRSGLTRAIQFYINNDATLKKKTAKLTSDDMREGLIVVLALRMPNPQFSSQTKNKLISSEARLLVEQCVYDTMCHWLMSSTTESKKIIDKMIEACEARESAKNARDLTRRKTALEINSLPGKLSDCAEKNPALSEIFIVEGDSAGGSCTQGRDSKFQAVLPLRGKILNVERVRFHKMLASQVIGTLIKAVGAHIGEGFDVAKTRYHKIIIMTDADVDGSHILTLLLTFFFRYMKPIIEAGYLYIAQPPLYGIKRGNNTTYLKDDAALQKFLLQQTQNYIKIYKNSDFIKLFGNILMETSAGNEEVDEKELEDEILEKGSVNNTEQEMSWDVVLNIIAEAQIFHDKLMRAKRSDDSIVMIEQSWILYNNLVVEDIENKSQDILHSDMFLQKLQDRFNKIFTKNTDTDINASAGLWNIEKDESFIKLISIQNGEHCEYTMNKKWLDDLTKFYTTSPLLNLFCDGLVTTVKNKHMIHYSISEFWLFISALGRKGIHVQRYKGLGEMSAEDLWNTTMNPKNRRLLRVYIENDISTDGVVGMLMGDEVESRRAFISIKSGDMSIEKLDL